MNTQQRRAQNCGSDKLTEELEGFCNKPIHSVGLKYLPIPHSQGQLYFGLTFYMAFLCLPESRGAGLHSLCQRLGLQRPGLGFWSYYLPAERGLGQIT